MQHRSEAIQPSSWTLTEPALPLRRGVMAALAMATTALGIHWLTALLGGGDIDALENDVIAAHIVPSSEALAERTDRSEGLAFKLNIDLATGEVIYDGYVVAKFGEMQGSWPTTETVAAQNNNAHKQSPARNSYRLISLGASPQRFQILSLSSSCELSDDL
jgi:hypothetical protein